MRCTFCRVSASAKRCARESTRLFREAGDPAARWRSPCWSTTTVSSSTNLPTTLRVLFIRRNSTLQDEADCAAEQDLEAILWLESFLASLPSTLVITSHDQAFLDNVVSETVEIRNGGKLEYFEGTPTAMKVERKKQAKRAKGAKEALDKRKEHVRCLTAPSKMAGVLICRCPQIEKSIAQSKVAAKKSGDDNR